MSQSAARSESLSRSRRTLNKEEFQFQKNPFNQILDVIEETELPVLARLDLPDRKTEDVRSQLVRQRLVAVFEQRNSRIVCLEAFM